MIKLRRPARAPAVLNDKGRNQTKSHIAAFNRSPADYRSGKKSFAFDRDIYAAAEVKQALKRAQSDKCCFCESKVAHIAYGDVEHFRPKGGYRQYADGELRRPGYYWLAYAWENLLFCCQICNQRFKRNLFPLVDPAHRARSHKDDHSRERPLFIDPYTDDPAALIGFRKEVPYPLDDNPRANITIEALGLDREPLNERRRDHLATMKIMIDIARLQLPQGRRARAWLAKAALDSAEYAAMARAFFAD